MLSLSWATLYMSISLGNCHVWNLGLHLCHCLMVLRSWFYTGLSAHSVVIVRFSIFYIYLYFSVRFYCKYVNRMLMVCEWTVGVKDIITDIGTQLTRVDIITVLLTVVTDITHVTIPSVSISDLLGFLVELGLCLDAVTALLWCIFTFQRNVFYRSLSLVQCCISNCDYFIKIEKFKAR